MSEPQAPEVGIIDRALEREEINKANRRYRSRLSKALGRYPKIRTLMSKEVWEDAPVAEVIDIPRRNPEWRHTISRTSTEITIRSKMLSDPDTIEDNLSMHLSEANPGIRFTRAVWEKPPEVFDGRRATLPEAEKFVTRIETQLGRPATK